MAKEIKMINISREKVFFGAPFRILSGERKEEKSGLTKVTYSKLLFSSGSFNEANRAWAITIDGSGRDNVAFVADFGLMTTGQSLRQFVTGQQYGGWVEEDEFFPILILAEYDTSAGGLIPPRGGINTRVCDGILKTDSLSPIEGMAKFVARSTSSIKTCIDVEYDQETESGFRKHFRRHLATARRVTCRHELNHCGKIVVRFKDDSNYSVKNTGVNLHELTDVINDMEDGDSLHIVDDHVFLEQDLNKAPKRKRGKVELKPGRVEGSAELISMVK